MEKNILKEIKVEEFYTRLMKIIEFIAAEDGKVLEFDDEKKKIVLKSKSMYLEINTKEDEITYDANMLNYGFSGEQKKSEKGYYVKFTKSKKNKLNFENNNITESHFEESVKMYDINLETIYEKEALTTESLIIDNITGKTTTCKPDVLKNISEEKQTWYTKDGIIKRYKREYNYPEEIKKQNGFTDIDKYYFGKNNIKEEYVEIDEIDFLEMFENKILKNVRTK